MKTLRLFNAVIAKPNNCGLTISQDGFIIERRAKWAQDQIIDHYTRERLDGKDLNKTFHKSWLKIKDSSRFDLFLEQIAHYFSTYGSDFKTEMYVPDEILDLPNEEMKFFVVKAYSEKEMLKKCFTMLNSGIALQEDTLNDLLSVMVEDLGYEFTGNDGVKNKEAIVKIADMYGVIPTDTMDFFRYIIYRTTGKSLLIKNQETIDSIKCSNYNPSAQFNKFGLVRLAAIFNRFKPLFLAFKPKCGKTINKIAKLSKKHHTPLVSNPLNRVTSQLLSILDSNWLDNATPFALFKALSVCYARTNGQDSFVYRIRNGKSFIKESNNNKGFRVCMHNYSFLDHYIKERFNLSGKKLYFPKDVSFALPTSEKMFVGNIPTGTSFFGEKMAVGLYWENAWKANDLDLSGINIGGKVGWNSAFNQNNGSLMYSGDITNAPNGAVEYLYANRGLNTPTLIQNNVYSGDPKCGYKLIIGRGDDISKDYMMNPNNLFAEVKCESVETNTILGIFIPTDTGRQRFVVLNFGAGSARVSSHNHISDVATKALYQQWANPLCFQSMVLSLGAEMVNDPKDADISYDLNSLSKDSFIKIFDHEEDSKK